MFGWDVLFYGTFGIVVTSSVKIAGVLLVFALLVIPSVAGVLVSDKASVRLIVGWSFAFVCSVLGLAAAFLFDAPAAPMILTVLTAALIVHGLAVTAIGKLRTR